MLTVIKKQLEAITDSPQNLILVVGVSGGRDSMALLHGLWHLQKNMEFTLVAAHFNHGIRGEAADGDEKMVSDFCFDYDIIFESIKEDVVAKAKAEKGNLEAIARACRYNWLDSLCQKYERELAGGSDKIKALIVTAHHLEDQGETILLHLLRGCGTQGLGGMKPLQGRILRPLLTVSRKDMEGYLAEFAIPWRDDASNFEAIYTRNKIRLELWQQLLEFNPRLSEALGNTAIICRSENDFLEEAVLVKAKEFAEIKSFGSKIGFDIEDRGFQKLHVAVRRRLIRYFWQQAVLKNTISGDTEANGLRFRETENLLNLKNSGKLTLPKGVFAERGGGRLYIGCQEGLKNQ